MNPPTAFIFPGQASQYPGMGRELTDSFPEAGAVLAEADRALGFSIARLCFEGKPDELQLTEIAQPAILAVSMAACAVLSARGIRPQFVAGHSLGEYSAIVAAGGLSLADAIGTVRKRGQYMQEAVPVGQGAMAALLGMPLGSVESLCREAAQCQVLAPANLNSPVQIVIAGAAEAVRRAIQLAPQRGARRAISLPVSAPFHCALMKPARDRLEKDLSQLRFRDLHCPLVTNADAAAIQRGSEVAGALVRQVCAPVRWSETIQFLTGQGVRRFVEVGPGRVLSGLVRQTDRSLEVLNVEDGRSLHKTLAAMGSAG